MIRRAILRSAIFLVGLMSINVALGAEPAGYPITIEHEYGQTVLPAKPVRIVSLEPAEITDSLIALGHPPVASATYGLENAWPPVVRDQALGAGIRSIGTPSEPSLEAIAMLEPDLIIAYPWQAATHYRRLSLIAPTLVVTSQRDFRPSLRRIATALDASPKAEALLEQLEQAQQEIQQAHGGTDIAIIRPRQFSTWLYGPSSNAGRLLTEAGLNVVVPIEGASVTPDSPDAINDMSLERVPGIKAGFLFFIRYNLEEPLGSYLRHPIWQRNTAVTEGRIEGVQGIAWTNHGPMGALEMLREVKRALDAQSGH